MRPRKTATTLPPYCYLDRRSGKPFMLAPVGGKLVRRTFATVEAMLTAWDAAWGAGRNATVGDALRSFARSLEVRGVSHETAADYLRCVRSLTPVWEAVRVADVDDAMIDQWHAARGQIARSRAARERMVLGMSLGREDRKPKVRGPDLSALNRPPCPVAERLRRLGASERAARRYEDACVSEAEAAGIAADDRAEAIAAGRKIKRQRKACKQAAVKGLHARRTREAMPPWADREAIAALYVEAKRLTVETGVPHEVDHIEPLLGENASGLHVHYNLRVITRTENRRKSNRRA